MIKVRIEIKITRVMLLKMIRWGMRGGVRRGGREFAAASFRRGPHPPDYHGRKRAQEKTRPAFKSFQTGHCDVVHRPEIVIRVVGWWGRGCR